jgi:hypothetical protein
VAASTPALRSLQQLKQSSERLELRTPLWLHLFSAAPFLYVPDSLEIAMQMHFKALVAALLISSPLIALAVEEHHPDTPPTAPTTAATAPVTAQDKAMSEQMEKMQAAHEKMIAAKTPAERQAAMQEGMATMKDSMGMMHNHCQGMGMGKGMSGGMAHSDQMMDMMMKMMDQQSNMMKKPMSN